MRMLHQPSTLVLALLLLLFCGGAVPSFFSTALANRLGGSGRYFLVAQRTGQAFSMGYNADGQLGQGIDDYAVDFPTQVKHADGGALDNVVDVCGGFQYACVRRAGNNNQVACSGDGDYLGRGEGSSSSNVFINVPELGATSGVSNILCGAFSAFALNNVTGQAWAWGLNRDGVLGLGSDDYHVHSPTLIPAFGINNKVIQIDSGENHACFLTKAGKVLCAGSNRNSVLGINIEDDYDQVYKVNVPVAVVFAEAESTTFTSVSCGHYHACASDSTGRVWCWGSNEDVQQAAEHRYTPVILPTVIPGVQDVRFVWAGASNVFAMLNDGTALAWGKDQHGVFGGESIPNERRTPVPFGRGVGGVQELQGGHLTTCILTVQDQVRCVGNNQFGQFGVGPGVPSSLELMTMGQDPPTWAPTVPRTRAPATASTLRKRLAGLGSFYLVLQLNGDVFAVGSNRLGQLGLGIDDYVVDYPQIVDGVFDVVDVSAGDSHACLLLGPGREVVCAGGEGRLGVYSTEPSHVFVPAIGMDATKGVTDVFCGEVSTFALNNNTGQVWAWGNNAKGLLGVGHSGSPVLIPIPIPAFGELGLKAVDVASGEIQACFLTVAGKVLCSGRNGNGVLGLNIDDNYHEVHVPTPVVFPDADSTTFTAVSCGYHHACAIDSTGRVWCWGENRSGQLAIEEYEYQGALQPTLIPGVQDVKRVWGGRSSVLAALSNGSALAWGRDTYGLFGAGKVSEEPFTPVSYGQGVSGIAEIRGGYRTTCILTTQDQVQCAGRSLYGQFGVGPGTEESLVLLTMARPLTGAPTPIPTKQPTAPTKQPTRAPTKQPTSAPTTPTTNMPTKRPTLAPTAWPTTKAPTKKPTTAPTNYPTKYPTKAPTMKPTKKPTTAPSQYPTKAPTSKPTKNPTKAPTHKPTTKYPTKYPTKAPTSKPTVATG